VTHVRDANGNLKDDGTNLYDYDYRNQLVRIRRKSDLSVVGTYDYDGACRRIAKSTSAGTTTFYWIGFELAMEYDASGLVSRRQRGAGFNEVASAYQRDIADLDQDGSTTDYVPLTPLYDGAYDCIGVLDQAGALAESYVHSYDGVVRITNAVGSTIPTSAIGWQQGYGCLYRDAESGLLYAVHRYYNPTCGRFATEDPLGRWFDPPEAGSGYGLAAARYRNGWDPLGLSAERLSPAEQELLAEYNLLTEAVDILRTYGPAWVQRRLRDRMKFFDGGHGFVLTWLDPPEEGNDRERGRCPRGQNEKIKIDRKRLKEMVEGQRLYGRAAIGDWQMLLQTLIHELVHDYSGFTVLPHPAVDALGVGAGSKAYDDAAGAWTRETTSRAEDSGAAIPWAPLGR